MLYRVIGVAEKPEESYIKRIEIVVETDDEYSADDPIERALDILSSPGPEWKGYTWSAEKITV